MGSANQRREPEWLHLTRTGSNQTGLGTDDDIIFNSSDGVGIPYNETTGVASLKGGRVYEILTSFALLLVDGPGDIAEIQWVNDSDDTPLDVSHETRIREMASTSNGTSQSVIVQVFSPVADIDIKPRCTEYEGSPGDTFDMYADRSYSTVKRL